MDFLQRLAASALGETGALRAALPSRFETWPAARFDAATDDKSDVGIDGSSPMRDPRSGDAGHVVHALHAERHDRSQPGGVPRESAITAAAQTVPPAVPTGGGRPAVVETSRPAPTSPVPRDVDARTLGQSHPPRAADDDSSPRSNALSAHAPYVARPALAPPRARAPVTTPLDAAVLASQPVRAQAARASAGPTVVHVTIDRIDVRAPGAVASNQHAAPPARPKPARSLAEYLRGDSR